MKGYKIFGPDYTCRGYKFSDINTCSGELKICENGFHFCVNAVDCLEYYEYSPLNTYAIVESLSPVQILDNNY